MVLDVFLLYDRLFSTSSKKKATTPHSSVPHSFPDSTVSKQQVHGELEAGWLLVWSSFFPFGQPLSPEAGERLGFGRCRDLYCGRNIHTSSQKCQGDREQASVISCTLNFNEYLLHNYSLKKSHNPAAAGLALPQGHAETGRSKGIRWGRGGGRSQTPNTSAGSHFTLPQ